VSSAVRGARPADGPAPAALGRIVEAVLPIADELRYLDLGPDLWQLPELVDAWYPLEATLDAVVVRGQRNGDLRADVPTALVTDVVVGAIWAAGDSVAQGRSAPRDAASGLVTLLLHGAQA
jgi:hypothetical protein